MDRERIPNSTGEGDGKEGEYGWGSVLFLVVLSLVAALLFLYTGASYGETGTTAGAEQQQAAQPTRETADAAKALPVSQGQTLAGAAPQPRVVSMTITDCVALALKNNLDLKGSFLDRVTQRFDLKVAERMFLPKNFLLSLGTQRSSIYGADVDVGRTTDGASNGNLTGTWILPTGGSFAFNWGNQTDRPDVSENVVYSGQWSITFSQPLLKGAGTTVAMAPLTAARMAEQDNIANLKDAMVATITGAVTRYRAYLSAVQQLDISKNSLESARNTYDINKTLIEAGRMARSELVQAEYDIANQESAVERSTADLDAARLDLVQFLDFPSDVRFELTEEKAPAVKPPGFDMAHDLALANRTDYEKGQRAFDLAKLNYEVGKNGRLWDLSLSAGTGRTAISGGRYGDVWDRTANVGKSDWNAGLTLKIPLLDLTAEQGYVRAKVALEKQRLALKKLEMTIDVDVKNNLRSVDAAYKQWQLQRQALTLAQQRYETEQEKLALGRSSNFQLLTFKNGLADSRLAELRSRMSYLSALNALDNSLGTTLDSWGIKIDRKDDAPPAPIRDEPRLFGQVTGNGP